MALNKQESEVRKTEGFISIIAAIIVLASAMLDPIVSAAGSVALLLFFGIYHLSASSSKPKVQVDSVSPAPSSPRITKPAARGTKSPKSTP